MTIKEIAKMAGVSPSTVSKIINHPGMNHSSPEVQQRVWDIVNQYNYVPNIMAQRLRMNIQVPLSRTLGVIFAETNDKQMDPFFSHVSKSIAAESCKYGYELSYFWSANEVDESFWEQVNDLSVDGIVVLGTYDRRIENILKKRGKKVVVCSLDSGINAFDHILCDTYEAATKAMSYLLKCGHTQIAFIGSPVKDKPQYRGYVDTLSAVGLPIDRRNIFKADRSYSSGQTAAQTLLKSNRRITAAFCSNDLVAIGFLREAKIQHVAVPNDISVIGIYDIRAASYSNPPLTTVRIPADSLGRHAVLSIIDRIWNSKKQPIKIMLPTKLISRESVKTIP